MDNGKPRSSPSAGEREGDPADSLRVLIRHETRYEYSRPVSLSPHVLRLHPTARAMDAVERYELAVDPAERYLYWHEDVYGNRVARVTFPNPTRELTLTVTLAARLNAVNPFDFVVDEAAANIPFEYGTEDRRALAAYLALEPRSASVLSWVDELRQRHAAGDSATVDFLVAVNRAVAEKIRYVVRLEPGTQSCEVTLAQQSGSCRDSGWLLAQTLRHFGVATRFVSGYLVQLADAVGHAHDTVALHAWCDAYVPGAGWIGFDATSGLLTAQHHIPLAVAAVPDCAAPVQGTADLSESRLSYDMRVTREHSASIETPGQP